MYPLFKKCIHFSKNVFPFKKMYSLFKKCIHFSKNEVHATQQISLTMLYLSRRLFHRQKLAFGLNLNRLNRSLLQSCAQIYRMTSHSMILQTVIKSVSEKARSKNGKKGVFLKDMLFKQIQTCFVREPFILSAYYSTEKKMMVQPKRITRVARILLFAILIHSFIHTIDIIL